VHISSEAKEHCKNVLQTLQKQHTTLLLFWIISKTLSKQEKNSMACYAKNFYLI